MKRMTKTILAFISLSLLLTLPSWSHGEHEGGVNKALLKKLFPTATSFVTKPLKMEDVTRKAIETELGVKLEGHDLSSPAFVATVKGKSIGVAWATDVHFPKKAADVIVGTDLQGKLVGVVLDHSSISSLSQSSYLKQYQGKTSASKFKVGVDLEASEKHVKPSQDLADAVRRATVVLSRAILKQTK